ncbi:UNVERIFIED_CONTAM: Amino acid transporter AVT6A [Sesamum radiatum]|uniref:Amino acid transporter AVT6A n=1 Tax=Sesamum radiatum TaxID=300843 RepID=A0AAW2VRK8_SESRA
MRRRMGLMSSMELLSVGRCLTIDHHCRFRDHGFTCNHESVGTYSCVAVIIFMAFLTEASIEFMLRFSRTAKAVSYGGLMEDAFGKYGRMAIQFCVLVNNVGGLVVYMIIIGDVLSGTTSGGIHHNGVLEGWFGQHWWTGRFFILLITTLAIFAPLASLKRIDSLRYTSALSVALAMVFLIVTMGITLFKLINGTILMPRLFPDVTNLASFFKLFTAVPVLVTAYICHYNVHSINNELEDNIRMKAAVRTSLALCSSVYVMSSVFGFLLFGDATLDDVLANFSTDLGIPFGSLLNDAVRVSYAAHLMLVPYYILPTAAKLRRASISIFEAFVLGQPEVCITQHWAYDCGIFRCKFHTQHLGRFPVHWSYCSCLHWFYLSCCSYSTGSIWDSHKTGQDVVRLHDSPRGVLKSGGIYSDAYALFKKNPSLKK